MCSYEAIDCKNSENLILLKILFALDSFALDNEAKTLKVTVIVTATAIVIASTSRYRQINDHFEWLILFSVRIKKRLASSSFLFIFIVEFVREIFHSYSFLWNFFRRDWLPLWPEFLKHRIYFAVWSRHLKESNKFAKNSIENKVNGETQNRTETLRWKEGVWIMDSNANYPFIGEFFMINDWR